jgi:hypothetical protein
MEIQLSRNTSTKGSDFSNNINVSSESSNCTGVSCEEDNFVKNAGVAALDHYVTIRVQNKGNQIAQTSASQKASVDIKDKDNRVVQTHTDHHMTIEVQNKETHNEKTPSTGLTKNALSSGLAVVNHNMTIDTTNSKFMYNMTNIMHQDPLLYSKFDSDQVGGNLWKQSKKLPLWMKKYFLWHREQRQICLNPQDWKSCKYLIMECLEKHTQCGGTSDRLKPLPTMLRMAASTDRLLLIHWNRPAKLEEFLLPPKGGLDWRVPDWLREY